MYSPQQPQDLISTVQPTKTPNTNHPTSNNSQFLHTFKDSTQRPSTDNITLPQYITLVEFQREEHSYIVRQLNKTIQHLKHSLQQQQLQRQLQNKNSYIYYQLFNQLKNIFRTDDIPHIIQQITCQQHSQNQKDILDTILQHSKQVQYNLRQEIHTCHQKIQQLRAQLLKSSQNNISTIFNSIPQSNYHSIIQQINLLHHQIYNLKTNLQSSLHHQPKTYQVEQIYQQMTNNYNSINETINLLHCDQIQIIKHFNVIKNEIKYIVNEQKNKLNTEVKNKQLIQQLSNKYNNLIESLNTPQIAKQEVYDSLQISTNNDLLMRITILSDQVKQTQQMIQNQKYQKIILENRVQQLEFVKSSLKNSFETIHKLENKIKIKNKRIVQLENTIIDHIQSQVNKQKNKSTMQKIDQINLEKIEHMLTSSKKNNQLLYKQIQQGSQLKIKKFSLIFNKVLQNLNDLKQALNTQTIPIKTIKTYLNLIIQNLNNSLSYCSNQESHHKNNKKIIFHKKNIR